jgi:serine/threonine-protein kinase
VSALPKATESDGIIAAIGGWERSDDNFMIDFSLMFMHANSSTPLATFSLDSSYDPDNDHTPVPVPAGGALEGESGYSCTGGGDCHLLVINDSTQQLFELWQVTSAIAPNFTATDETVWDLTKHYGPDGRGLGCTSADAAGLPIVPGLIGVREVVKDGAIHHALRFSLPNAYIRRAFVFPATHLTSVASSTAGPPYGTRLRLKASFDESRVSSSGGKIVIRALKQYGMILADGSNYDTLMAESDQLESRADPTLSWLGVLDGADLNGLLPSDFEVVAFGPLQTNPDCVRAP